MNFLANYLEEKRFADLLEIQYWQVNAETEEVGM